MDRLVPGDPNETDEEYNRAELSALVRIQYEERRQRQRDLAILSETGGISPPGNMNVAKRKNRVQHMANQLNAEKQRKAYDEYQTKSTRSWRQLKQEIMAAADERMSNLDSSDGPTHHKRVSSGGLQSLLERIPSLTSPSAAQYEAIAPAHEQIAPPLERTEVKVVEGALNLKCMCALDVYTPLKVIFAVPEDLVLTQEVRQYFFFRIAISPKHFNVNPNVGIC